MTIYNGRYRWDGIKKNNREPIAWSAGAYDVKIFKRSLTRSAKVELLKPYICVYSPTGEGQSISANPEKFAKHLCEDFSLELERVLWVEDHENENKQNRYEVVTFTRSGKLGQTIFYKSDKRTPLDWEIEQLEKELRLLRMS